MSYLAADPETWPDYAKLELLADLLDKRDDERAAASFERTVQVDLRRIAALLRKVAFGEALLIVKENGEWPEWVNGVAEYTEAVIEVSPDRTFGEFRVSVKRVLDRLASVGEQ